MSRLHPLQAETASAPRPAAPAATPERPLLDVHVRRKSFGQRTVLNNFRLARAPCCASSRDWTRTTKAVCA